MQKLPVSKVLFKKSVIIKSREDENMWKEIRLIFVWVAFLKKYFSVTSFKKFPVSITYLFVKQPIFLRT
jgi:hypothetical protein